MNREFFTKQLGITKAAPGDLNMDGKFSIGDLGLISAGYGMNSESADCAKYELADMNNDGKIDIVDLAAIVSLILS